MVDGHAPRRRLSRRFIFVGLAVIAMMAVTATPAFATKPTRRDARGTGSFTLDASCSFPVRVVLSSHAHATTFSDTAGDVRLVMGNGSAFVTLTNTETGTSIRENVSGPIKIYPDGPTVGTGAGLSAQTGSLVLTHGRIVTNGSGDIVSQTGRTTDMCAL